MLIDVKKVTPVSHPFEEGVTVGIRALRGVEMDEAANNKIKKTVATWGDALASLTANAKASEDTIASRIVRYDAATLLEYAVVSWSYPEPVSPENLSLLDSITREWLVEEVVTRNTRPLPSSTTGAGSSSPVSALPS